MEACADARERNRRDVASKNDDVEIWILVCFLHGKAQRALVDGSARDGGAIVLAGHAKFIRPAKSEAPPPRGGARRGFGSGGGGGGDRGGAYAEGEEGAGANHGRGMGAAAGQGVWRTNDASGIRIVRERCLFLDIKPKHLGWDGANSEDTRCGIFCIFGLHRCGYSYLVVVDVWINFSVWRKYGANTCVPAPIAAHPAASKPKP